MLYNSIDYQGLNFMKKRIIVILSFFLFLNANATQYTQQDVQRFSAYYSNGIEYLKNQQFTSAINEFRKVLRFSPYDETIQDALANAYYARAQYYRTTTKEVKKALNDYKSAYFYSKYWKDTQQSQAQAQLSYNALKAINELEKRIEKYYNLLKIENELSFILNGTYIKTEDINNILNGTY